MRETLKEALKTHEEDYAKAQEQLLDAGNEVKRLTKADKQLKQRENALHEDTTAYRSPIDELELTASELKACTASTNSKKKSLISITRAQQARQGRERAGSAWYGARAAREPRPREGPAAARARARTYE